MKVVVATPLASATTCIDMPPLGKVPQASLPKVTISLAAGCPAALRKRAAITMECPARTLVNCGVTAKASVAAAAADAAHADTTPRQEKTRF